MTAVSGSQAVPMDQQANRSTTPPLAQADTNQNFVTTAPAQVDFSDASHQTDSGATTPVPRNSVTSCPEIRQRVMEWCSKRFLTICIGVILTTMYFVLGYAKKAEQQWASIEDEYNFCEAHPVRLTTHSRSKDRADFCVGIPKYHRVQEERISGLEEVRSNSTTYQANFPYDR